MNIKKVAMYIMFFVKFKTFSIVRKVSNLVLLGYDVGLSGLGILIPMK